MKSNDVLATRLRLARLSNDKKITQKQIALDLGIGESTYGSYETVGSNRTPNPHVLAEIAKYLNVSVDYLLGLTEDDNIIVRLDDSSKVIIDDKSNHNELNTNERDFLMTMMKQLSNQIKNLEKQVQDLENEKR